MTASKSRKKHQQEIMQRAIQAEELNKKSAREKFFFTNLNYLQCASYEPLMHQTKEEQEEGIINNVSNLAKTLSLCLS